MEALEHVRYGTEFPLHQATLSSIPSIPGLTQGLHLQPLFPPPPAGVLGRLLSQEPIEAVMRGVCVHAHEHTHVHIVRVCAHVSECVHVCVLVCTCEYVY